MGKIFGISDNPVSIIERALNGYNHIEPPVAKDLRYTKDASVDKFISSVKKASSKPKTGTPNFARKMLSFFKK